MILGFKEFFDTKKQNPTYFREKILLNVASSTSFMICDGKSIRQETLERAAGESRHFNTWQSSPDGWNKGEKVWHPKRHTFRLDPHDRWKPGMSIQMVYRKAGYKIKDEFNKGIPELSKCVSTQKIEITHRFADVGSIGAEVYIDGRYYSLSLIRKNDVIHFSDEDSKRIEKLAINDGFDSVKEFFGYFNKDFSGKIIHWTDLRY